jgi:hypothetical protein
MRSIAFAPAFLIIGSFSLAHGAPRINLDQPGVLNELKLQHPQRYQAVSALLRASERAPCQGSKIELLKTRFNIKDLECGMMVITSYPARRYVSFELDRISYEATVVLKGDDKLQPISPPTDMR